MVENKWKRKLIKWAIVYVIKLSTDMYYLYINISLYLLTHFVYFLFYKIAFADYKKKLQNSLICFEIV